MFLSLASALSTEFTPNHILPCTVKRLAFALVQAVAEWNLKTPKWGSVSHTPSSLPEVLEPPCACSGQWLMFCSVLFSFSFMCYPFVMLYTTLRCTHEGERDKSPFHDPTNQREVWVFSLSTFPLPQPRGQANTGHHITNSV